MTGLMRVQLGQEAAEVIGLYNGVLAELIVQLHQVGTVDGWAFVRMRTPAAETQLGGDMRDALIAAIRSRLERLEGRSGPALRVVDPAE